MQGLKNLREACERQLRRFQSATNAVANEVGADYMRVPRSTGEEVAREEALKRRRERIQQVRDNTTPPLLRSSEEACQL